MHMRLLFLFLFFCGSLACTSPATISSTTANASEPWLACNSLGDAIVVWQQDDGTIQAAMRHNNGDWSSPVTIGNPGFNTSFPSVAVNEDGFAIACWAKTGSHFYIQAATYDFDTNIWTSPVNVTSSSATVDRYHPVVAMNSSGNAVVTWTLQTASNYFFIESSTYSSGSFGSIVTVSDQMVNETNVNSIGFNDNGNIFPVWNKNPVNNPRLGYAFSSNSGSSWTSSTLSSNGYPTPNPEIFVGPTIKGTSWIYADIATSEPVIYASIGSSSSLFWNVPAQISGSNNAGNPHIAGNIFDDMIVTWSESDGSNTRLYSSSCVNASSWSSPLTISSAGLNATLNSVAANNGGYCSAIWLSANGPAYTMLISHSVLSGIWTLPTAISETSSFAFSNPQVKVGLDNKPVAIWIAQEGAYTVVQSNIPTTPVYTVDPPASFNGKVIENESLVQSEIIHRLTWAPSPSPLTDHYVISRNGLAIASISTNQLFFYNDRGRSAKPDTYSIIAVDIHGFPSTPLTLTLP